MLFNLTNYEVIEGVNDGWDTFFVWVVSLLFVLEIFNFIAKKPIKENYEWIVARIISVAVSVFILWIITSLAHQSKLHDHFANLDSGHVTAIYLITCVANTVFYLIILGCYIAVLTDAKFQEYFIGHNVLNNYYTASLYDDLLPNLYINGMIGVNGLVLTRFGQFKKRQERRVKLNNQLKSMINED